MRTQSKIVRKQKPVAEIVVMFLLVSAIAGMALVLNSQNEIFATPRQQSGERSPVTLPPLQIGATSIDLLLHQRLVSSPLLSGGIQIMRWDTDYTYSYSTFRSIPPIAHCTAI